MRSCRDCGRTTPSKVFGIGLSRTGTTSLNEALRLLGRTAVHFPLDDISQRELSRYLRSPTPTLRLTILDTVDALTDTPVSATYRGLDRAYLGSRFIMTIRERSAWLASCRAYWQGVLTPILATAAPQRAAYIRLVNHAIYGTEKYDADRFADAYDRHLAGARRHFSGRPDAYLELDICGGQGWDVLGEFLGAEVPHYTFPAANALL